MVEEAAEALVVLSHRLTSSVGVISRSICETSSIRLSKQTIGEASSVITYNRHKGMVFNERLKETKGVTIRYVKTTNRPGNAQENAIVKKKERLEVSSGEGVC